VALTHSGGTYAVMMTTQLDLEDFAVGFSLSEGVISTSADIDSFDVVRLDNGGALSPFEPRLLPGRAGRQTPRRQ
jgi:formate dehydrogenase assembly factor FdhD